MNCLLSNLIRIVIENQSSKNNYCFIYLVQPSQLLSIYQQFYSKLSSNISDIKILNQLNFYYLKERQIRKLPKLIQFQYYNKSTSGLIQSDDSQKQSKIVYKKGLNIFNKTMHSLQQLEQKIQLRPFLVKQYIANNLKDPKQLETITSAIINVHNRQGPSNLRNSLDQCNSMAISANLTLVQVLYFKILPELIKKSKENPVFKDYLKTWVTMYHGKWKCSNYPNFASKYSKYVANLQVPAYLEQSLKQFQTNINKSLNQTIQFFQDSSVQDSDTERSIYNNQIGTPAHYEQVDLLKLKSIKQGLQRGNDTRRWLNELYQFRYKYSKNINNRTQSSIQFNQELIWINKLLKFYEDLKQAPNWQQSLNEYYRQLNSGNNLNTSPLGTHYLQHFDNTKINSERMIHIPRTQQNFKEFRKSILKHSQIQSGFQSLKVENEGHINHMNMDQIHSQSEQNLIVKKYIPQFADSINHSRLRYSVIDKTYAENSPSNDKKPIKHNHQPSSLNKSIKLSQFSNQKNIRKQSIYNQDLDTCPQWILTPFTKFFYDDGLFERYRKNCLMDQCMIFQDQKLSISCAKIRTSACALEFSIVYRNLVSSPLNLVVCYKIAQQCYQVRPHKKIRSRFSLNYQQSHEFTLNLKQLPLKICTLELSYNSRIVQIPIPFTIFNFVAFQDISRQRFYEEWREYSTSKFSISKKIQYNPRILSQRQISEMLPKMVDLGRTQNYSFQEWGCKCKFQYYNLQFLLIFAYNVDTFLTFQLMSCKEIDSQRVQFLNYYLFVLMMMLQNRNYG